MALLSPRVWAAALLSPRVWAAVVVAPALAASHWESYRIGENSVRAEWTAEKLENTRLAFAASEANRMKEKALNLSVERLQNELSKEKSVRLAAAAALDSGLRDFQTANNLSSASSDSSPANGTNGTGGLERELLNACAANLIGLAKTADRLEGKVVGLQDYVRSVGLSK